MECWEGFLTAQKTPAENHEKNGVQGGHPQSSLLFLYITVNSLSQWTSLNFIFPTKYVIPKSLKFSHWPSKQSSQKQRCVDRNFGG